MENDEPVRGSQSAVYELVERLETLARADDGWRALLGRVGAELVAIASESRSCADEAAPPRDAADGSAEACPGRHGALPGEAPSGFVPRAAPPADVLPAAEAIQKLTLGKAVDDPVGERPAKPVSPGPGLDLALIEKRCRLKAEACNWAESRQKRIDAGADFAVEIEPNDGYFFERARDLPDCYLWMCSPDAPRGLAGGGYELLSHCYETLADAIAHTRAVEETADSQPEAYEQAIDLLAEAQSAVRAAVIALGRDRDDFDQKGVYLWLKETTSCRQIFVQRYMRADDRAAPEGWSELATRIEQAHDAVEAERRVASQRRKLIGKVRHKASRIEVGEAIEESWAVLVEAVEKLLADGLSPSDRELREALLGVIDDAPGSAAESPSFRLVAREVDRFLANRPAPRETGPAAPYNDAVRELREKLAGRSMVMIGGDRRPQAEQRLKEALGLSELHWLATRPHESIDRFESYVAREDVAVVIQMILYSSHSFGEVGEFCRKHGKAFVRLTGGYNPNQLATRVLQQCSDRL